MSSTRSSGEDPAQVQEGLDSARVPLKNLLASLLDLVHTRVDLLGTELREELLRFGLIMAGAVLVLLLVTVGAGMLAAALVLALWQEHALLGLSLAGACFLIAGSATVWAMSRVMRAKPRPFDASLNELRRDRDAFRITP